jgi:precorrin-6A/cobalt-precorrin-6A reductase
MGGTKDSINIIKFLKEESDLFNISPYILTTTTTDYGGKLAKNAGSDDVIAKPLSKEEIINILSTDNSTKNKNKNTNANETGNNFDLLIDATHPFATNATSTAIEAAKIADVGYIRFERPTLDYSKYKNVYFVDSFEEAGTLLVSDFKGKNILHLAGVNTIEKVLKFKEIPKKNFFARVLPVKSSIEKCNSMGIVGEHIIAMQGVFSKEFNEALMKEIDAQIIITKESGDTGGVPLKIEAANELGISIILVNRPKITNLEFQTVVNDLRQLKKALKLLEYPYD